MISIIEGDLLESSVKYLVHQTNCLSQGGAAGIAQAIFDKYPFADCYKDRQSPSPPGTLDIRRSSRYIVNLHGQYYPGRPNYPNSELDGFKAREKYFLQGLKALTKIPDLETVGFPYLIGCGIAGGDWDYYLKIITQFADYIEGKESAQVLIYRLEGK